MKLNKIIPMSLLMMFQRIRISSQTQKFLVALLILIILILSLKMFQGTLGKFSRSFILSDSAATAKFDVIIIVPKEFKWEDGQNLLECFFFSPTDIRGLRFEVYNDGEADVLCIPHVSNGITYRIYVAEQERSQFIVKAKERVDFWLAIAPDGLDTNIKDAELLIDIQQVKGG